ncbi:DUF805 domain-containing protein [Ligilactobacillus hayakitensis]|nr:DUF805 domain-containing protein [Ligilactobacillus hayakitensis]
MQQPKQVGMWQAFLDYWKGYVDFSGRTTRAGYWWIKLWEIISFCAVFFMMILAIVITDIATNGDEDAYGIGIMIVILLMIIARLATIIPGIAIRIRRFRDAGLTTSGAWILWGSGIFISVIFTIVFYASMFAEMATMGENLFIDGNASDAFYGGIGMMAIVGYLLQAVVRLIAFIVNVTGSDKMCVAPNAGAFGKFFCRQKEIPNFFGGMMNFNVPVNDAMGNLVQADVNQMSTAQSTTNQQSPSSSEQIEQTPNSNNNYENQ